MTSHLKAMFRSTATRALAAASARPTITSSKRANKQTLCRAASVHHVPIVAQPGRRYFSETVHSVKKCPACGTPLPTPLPACTSCSYIAPLPRSTTYHELLGLPPSSNRFDVDPSMLKDRFRQLQRVIHPDKWSNHGPVRYSFYLRIQ